MNEDDSMKDEGKWTRDDLFARREIVALSYEVRDRGLSSRAFADAVLDEVVEHLNAHHPKPAPDLLSSAAECVLGAEDRVRSAKAERDAAAARADQLRNERDDAVQSCMVVGRERDEWKARAEAAEARTAPTVTKAEVGKVIREALVLYGVAPERVTDAAWSLLSGSDPAVHVVRESDIAAVKVTEHAAGWSAESKHLVSGWGKGKHLSVDMDIDRYRAELLNALAVQRAIEAGQAVDPVEEKARELYEVGNPGTVGMWESIHEAFKDGYRRIARHVLGQEAGQ